MANDSLTVFSVGDVFPDLPEGLASFSALQPLLSSADVVFGNCEGVYSDRSAQAPSHKHFNATARDRGTILGEVPFHVMTCANNHMIDGGYAGLADTLELLHEQDILTTGAGASLREAIAPAIVERDGFRVAFLGFCTVYPVGYEARPGRPGLAPLRVRTFYADPDPNFWEPGIPPLIQTIPVAEDLADYREAIASARAMADFVIVANHWGYSGWVEVLQDYELELARDAVKHGADAVMCCHHHSLRGIEMHRGRPIFYGLGTLVHHFNAIRISAGDRAARQERHGDRSSMTAQESYPLFPFRAEARMTGVAVLELRRDGTLETGFIPAMIRPDGSTEPLGVDDPGAAEVCNYVERLSSASGFGTRFERTEREGWMQLSVGEGDRADSDAHT